MAEMKIIAVFLDHRGFIADHGALFEASSSEHATSSSTRNVVLENSFKLFRPQRPAGFQPLSRITS